MKEDDQKFMALLGHLPARLKVEEVALILNCMPHDVPTLVSAKLLKPLGNPPPNAVKYFSTLEIQKLSKDDKWLERMTKAICEHWRKKNARQKTKALSEQTPVAL